MHEVYHGGTYHPFSFFAIFSTFFVQKNPFFSIGMKAAAHDYFLQNNDQK